MTLCPVAQVWPALDPDAAIAPIGAADAEYPTRVIASRRLPQRSYETKEGRKTDRVRGRGRGRRPVPAERLAADADWQDNNCHEDGRMYISDALNWRFGKMTRRAGVGHWHAHEGRHTAVSIMKRRGVASDATFRYWREDDGASNPAGALSPPLTASMREITGQGGSARTRMHQMQRRCIQFRGVRCQHVASSSTSKPQRRRQMRHLAVGRAEVFSMVGNPLPTSCSNGVPLQEISDTVGHKSTHVTETEADLQSVSLPPGRFTTGGFAGGG